MHDGMERGGRTEEVCDGNKWLKKKRLEISHCTSGHHPVDHVISKEQGGESPCMTPRESTIDLKSPTAHLDLISHCTSGHHPLDHVISKEQGGHHPVDHVISKEQGRESPCMTPRESTIDLKSPTARQAIILQIM
ncbi:hypothetical protein RRG08_034513 [Elysia crispata]|uniref:Uncharacterized protein n=1 Tax=Elysia crispata TaxID=231223 RepID=A0AAE1ECY8_9GAST|nr:hypothetical protein RRG08_034513 [Elysia crispata]